MRLLLYRPNITQKFIGYILLLSFIPQILIGIASLRISSFVIREEVGTYTAELVKNEKDYLDLQLAQIESLMANISGVEEIRDAIDDADASEDLYTALATQARIGYILNGYLNLEGLVSIDIFTVGGAHYHVGDTLNIENSRTDVMERIFSRTEQANRLILWAGIEDNINANSSHQKVLTAAKLIHHIDPLTLEKIPQALFLVNYSVEYLYNHFSKANLGEGAYLMVIDEERRIIYHPTKELIGTETAPDVFEKLNQEQVIPAMNLDGKEMFVTSATSNVSGWIVISVIPLEALEAKTFAMQVATGVVLLICLVVSFFIAYLFNRQVVAPIRQVTSLFQQIQAGTLDWRTRMKARPGDEIGELIQWFNAFMETMVARQQAEDRLRHYAYFDELTGLPNRVMFLERLGQAIARHKRHPGFQFAVLFMDLDNFKLINDSLGHTLGNQLLIKIADRLSGRIRVTDLLARIGGDEFAFLIDDLSDTTQIIQIADRILRDLEEPFDLDDRKVFTTASMGIIFGDAKYSLAESYLRDADVAMYRAKESGRARYEIFDATMREQVMTRLALEADLRSAIEQGNLAGEFRVYYQPIIRLDTGELSGFEALLRWQHPRLGLVYPNAFISIAEETGLIIPIGRWVIGEVCRQLREWKTQLPCEPDLSVSINLSGKQVLSPDLVDVITAALRQADLSPHCLQLEVTEGTIIQEVEKFNAVLGRLKALGIAIQIDDFGTGYSSMSYLVQFGFNVLKIDRSFISEIDSREDKLGLVKAMVLIAEGLKMSVIAEGIETEEQLARLQAVGCELGQGFIFAYPLDSEAARQFILDRIAAPQRPA